MTEREQTCAGWDEDLSALLDAELDPGRREEVEAHVASCERCSERVEALRAVGARLGEIPLPEISGRLSPPRPEQAPAPPLQTMSEAPARTRSAPPRSAPRRAAWKTSPPVRIATAAAIVLALYWLLQPGSEPIPSPAPDSPSIAEVPSVPAPETTPRPDAPEPSEIVANGPASPSVPEPAKSLEDASDEELALAFDLETAQDLDVIANLELLERLIALEGGRG